MPENDDVEAAGTDREYDLFYADTSEPDAKVTPGGHFWGRKTAQIDAKVDLSMFYAILS